MRVLFSIFVSGIFALSFISGCATYPEINSGSVEVGNDNVYVKVQFGENDRRLIHGYYRNKYKDYKKKHKHLPPGLAKKKKLPPGLQKQLEKNRTLPPGLEKRRLPFDLERQLTKLPKRYVRLRVGTDIVLFDEIAQVILDIIYNVGE